MASVALGPEVLSATTAYNEVTSGKRKVKVVPELRQTLETCIRAFAILVESVELDPRELEGGQRMRS